MSVAIELIDSNFAISRNNIEPAFRAISNYLDKNKMKWIDKFDIDDYFEDDILMNDAIEDLSYEIRFPMEYDMIKKEWIICEFSGEKAGDEDVLFNILAPFSKEGSYILFKDEYHDCYGYKVKNKKIFCI